MELTGVPTTLDLVAQEVARVLPENKYTESKFHKNSCGYRNWRSQHQAIPGVTNQALQYRWAIDIDIKGYFCTIDHQLLRKPVSHYCKDRWILMYVKRLLKAGILLEGGMITDRITGTPQGGVISPLPLNISLHVVFDRWMEICCPEKPFERCAYDVVVHCLSK